MANTATVLDSTKIIGLCGAGAKISIVQLSIDANYAQGGYDIDTLMATAGIDGDIAAVLFQGPAFVDTVGGDCFIPNYYPSAGKLMLMRVTEVVAGTNVIEEIGDGALGVTFKVNCVVFHG